MLDVGLTGIGGGSFTVPALLLIVGLPAGEAVGTAFVFAGVLRLIAAPFYLLHRHVPSRYFRLMITGAVPGLVLGIIGLRWLAHAGSSPVVIIALRLVLAITSGVSAAMLARSGHWPNLGQFREATGWLNRSNVSYEPR